MNLDEIAASVSEMSDADLQAAAEKIQAQRLKARSGALSEERKQKALAAAKRRRDRDNAILKLAKSKGLVPEKVSAAPAGETATDATADAAAPPA